MAQKRTPINAAGRVPSAARRLLDVVLPERCLKCGVEVAPSGGLCVTCWEDVSFLAEPLCRICGIPFELGSADHRVCGACLRKPPMFDRARAAMIYDDASRGLLVAFKHRDRTDMAPYFSA